MQREAKKKQFFGWREETGGEECGVAFILRISGLLNSRVMTQFWVEWVARGSQKKVLSSTSCTKKEYTSHVL